MRDNVQLILRYPTPADQDTDGASITSVQPGTGYSLRGISFGAVVEGNIISSAMLEDDLGAASDQYGLSLRFLPVAYPGGQTYTQQGHRVRNNIIYRNYSGALFQGDAVGVGDIRFEGNVAVSDTPALLWVSGHDSALVQPLVATRMRLGGRKPTPASGKPLITGDYAWDTRYTAVAVVNWIRAGFGLGPVE